MSALSQDDSCAGCRFNHDGECRRYPPQQSGWDDETDEFGNFINREYWWQFPLAVARCGEYQMSNNIYENIQIRES